MRQSSLAGEAGAHLTAIDWTDQSIEADMRPLEFAGAGRWFGLVTRRIGCAELLLRDVPLSQCDLAAPNA